MELWALDSDRDIWTIIRSEEYRSDRVVVTESIEVVDKNGSSAFFSRPRGKRINFIKYRWAQPNYPWSDFGEIYSVAIFDYNFLRERFKKMDRFDHYDCACKQSGKQYLYNRHANFHANKKEHDRR